MIRAGHRVPYGSTLGAKIAHPGDRNACWSWRGAMNGHGYGVVRVNGSLALAHRVVYERCEGSIPEGYHIHHTCYNRGCVNPRHLQPLLAEINRWDWGPR